MYLGLIIQHYLLWHYTTALTSIWHVAGNLIWFVNHLFSLPQLTRSLVSPWKRITEGRGETLNLEDLAGYIIVNLISRIVGFIIRLTVILTGALIILLLAFATLISYAIWVLAPAVIIALVYYGLKFSFAAL